MDHNKLQVIAVNQILVVDSQLVAQKLGIDLSFLLGEISSMYLDATQILGLIRLLSLYGYSSNSRQFLFELFDKMTTNNQLYNYAKISVIENIANDAILRKTEKFSVQKWFEKNHQNFFDDSKLIKPYLIQQKRPDCILSIEGIDYPVECKLVFGVRGLTQLQNYMKLWNVNFGVAVAKKFTCKIPSNIAALKAKD